MVNNKISPDQLYLKSREQLLQYEDARMNSLIQGMANYYTTRNDQSIWGNFLRALAQEIGKLDYYYSYDIVNKNPSYLTPPDIRRRWNDPLYISSNWPSKTQFDTDFKTMLIELISAYREGSTAKGIQDVIHAYTGINIQVQELYKEIGNGVYDQSDRNAIKVSVSVGNNSLSEIATLTQLQQIVESLYGAIDLAKPAHVGLEFTTIFGEDEDIDCFISPAYVTQQQYITLTPTQQSLYSLTGYVLVNPPVFWQASTPTSNPFNLYTFLRDTNGNLQMVTTAGKPGTVEPVWNTASDGETVDSISSPPIANPITWTNISPAVTNLVVNAASLSPAIPTTVTVTFAPKYAPTFTILQQVKLIGLTDPNFTFLNGVQLSVLTSTSTTFTAALGFTHAPTASVAQLAGTVGYLPSASINLLTYSDLPSVLQPLYQQQYTNTNCSSSGIEDTLRIFIRLVEEPPETPMLIQAPVLDPTNPTTTVTAWGEVLSPALSVHDWGLLPTITFNVIKTVADGINATYTFDNLAGGLTVVPPNLDLHEGMRVTIVGCTNGLTGSSLQSPFNTTGKIQNVTSTTFQIPLAQTIALATETGSGTVTPTLQSAYALQGGQYVLLQDASLPPLSDPTLNPPTRWIAVIGVDKATNTPLNPYPSGEVANWDITHPAGLVAPRLSQTWEISGGDEYFIYGLS